MVINTCLGLGTWSVMCLYGLRRSKTRQILTPLLCAALCCCVMCFRHCIMLQWHGDGKSFVSHLLNFIFCISSFESHPLVSSFESHLWNLIFHCCALLCAGLCCSVLCFRHCIILQWPGDGKYFETHLFNLDSHRVPRDHRESCSHLLISRPKHFLATFIAGVDKPTPAESQRKFN